MQIPLSHLNAAAKPTVTNQFHAPAPTHLVLVGACDTAIPSWVAFKFSYSFKLSVFTSLLGLIGPN